jgi:hypothetical protein
LTPSAIWAVWATHDLGAGQQPTGVVLDPHYKDLAGRALHGIPAGGVAGATAAVGSKLGDCFYEVGVVKGAACNGDADLEAHGVR